MAFVESNDAVPDTPRPVASLPTRALIERSSQMAIREVARLLRQADDASAATCGVEYQQMLDAVAIELRDAQLPADSPLGALCTLLHEDRRLRDLLSVNRHSDAEA